MSGETGRDVLYPLVLLAVLALVLFVMPLVAERLAQRRKRPTQWKGRHP